MLKLEFVPNERKEKILKKILKNNSLSFLPVREKHYVCYLVEGENESVIKKVCTEFFLIGYKFDIMRSIVTKQDYYYYAFLGILLASNETEKALCSTYFTGGIVNMEGVLHFEGAEIYKHWKNVVSLGKRLIFSCHNDEDRKTLLMYFLGLSETDDVTLSISEEGIKDTKKEKFLSFYPLFDGKTENIITNLFFYHPMEIVVSPEVNLEKKLLCFLKELSN